MTFHAVPVLVGDDTCIAYLHESRLDPMAFYSSLDPGLYRIWVQEAGEASLTRDDLGDPFKAYSERDLHRALNLRIRYLYLHVLEVFFAHFFANVQSPWAPQAWLELYRPTQLRALTKPLATGDWSPGDHTTPFVELKALLLWMFGLSMIDPDARQFEATAIREVIERAARDYTDENHGGEYNTIKHGGRNHSGLGATKLVIRDADGRSAGMSADNASHFYVRERVRKNEWVLRRRMVGWDPGRDLRMAKALSMLLFNLITIKSRKPLPKVYGFASIDQERLLPDVGLISNSIDYLFDDSVRDMTLDEATAHGQEMLQNFVEQLREFTYAEE